MKYNFDKQVDRRGTNCVKWDEFDDPEIIPMWVADMDFETAPCITKALKERMEHGCYGYTFVPDSFYKATIDWFSRRHGWKISGKQAFVYTSGVVPALSAIIKAMAKAGEKVLIQTPVYNCFFSSIRNNGCEVVENPLLQCECVSVDWEDFERKCADPKVKVFVLCNPHNPVGRVWTKEELTRMGNICLNNGVFVISDEIHCEFVYSKEAPYTPFASISEDFAQNSAVCVSPSKAYNIAGLQIANIIAENSDVRARIDKAININEVCDVNPFGVIALQAAYSKEVEEWLNELCEYIHGNYLLAKSMIEKDLSEVKIAELQGTYLMWADVKALGLKSAELCHLLQKEGKVYVNPGTMYGEKTGEGYIRINLATRRSLVEEGMRRLVRVCCQHLGR